MTLEHSWFVPFNNQFYADYTALDGFAGDTLSESKRFDAKIDQQLENGNLEGILEPFRRDAERIVNTLRLPDSRGRVLDEANTAAPGLLEAVGTKAAAEANREERTTNFIAM